MRQLAAVRLREALAGGVEREVEWQPAEPACPNTRHILHELVVSDRVDRIAIDVLCELLGKLVDAFPALRRETRGHESGRWGEDGGFWVWAVVGRCGQVQPRSVTFSSRVQLANSAEPTTHASDRWVKQTTWSSQPGRKGSTSGSSCSMYQ